MARDRDAASSSSGAQDNTDGSVFRVPPFFYMHVLDQTSHVSRVEVGPLTVIRKDNERVLLPPTRMIVVPPRYNRKSSFVCFLLYIG
jgi:major vault protein